MICRLIALLAVFAPLACSSGDDSGGSGGTGSSADSTVKNWIYGTWKGSIRNKDEDPKATLHDGTTAKVTFERYSDETSENPRRGTFSMTFPERQDTRVKGRFKEYLDSGLNLEVAESNLTLVGRQGSNTILDYILMGDGLEVSNTKMMLQLTLDDGTDDGNTPTQAEGETKAPATATNLIHRWNCTDRATRAWAVNIKSDTVFDAEIVEGGTRLIYEGSVALVKEDKEKDAVLTVKSSNNPKAVGLELYVQHVGDIEMKLRRTERKNGALVEAEEMMCRKA